VADLSEWAGVILAAGKGVRMRSKTPKALHAVCGAPLLRHVAEAMRGAGLERIVAVASPELKNDPRFVEAAGAGAAISIQRQQLGTGNALLAARPACGDAAFVIAGAGDMPLVRPETIGRMVATHSRRRARLTVLICGQSPAEGMGRVRLSQAGDPVAIIEEKEAAAADRAIPWTNTSWYCFDASWLWATLPSIKRRGAREAYLTDLVEMAAAGGKTAAVEVTEPVEALGVNDRAQLARAEAAMRDRVRSRWMAEGVTLADPAATYIDTDVEIGPDTVVLPGVHLRGRTLVGAECQIGPNTVLTDCVVGDRSRIVASFGDGARIGDDVSVGPFSRLRPGTVIGARTRVGTFAEVKNSKVAEDVRISHFSYIGDTTLGRGVNIGAGTVTCNYDGERHHETHISAGAFIGSGTMLVAPLTVGKDAVTGAGAVVTHDVPAGETWVGNPARPLVRRRPGTSKTKP
jgi:bifunctional UDP-N-acetylglucosamine pyrophosphorylase/glucosamine-1-phosphate N-acetyltransferase